MTDPQTSDGVRERFAAKGEEALGRLAQDLLENPLVNGALTRALGVRDKAAQAQEVAMGALNLPSASDIERLTRRLRSVGQRLEGIEDGLDRLEQSAHRRSAGGADLAPRLEAIEERLTALSRQVDDLGAAATPRKPAAAAAAKPRAATAAAAKPRKRATPKA
jgi:chromosome segregation ATPase